MSTPYFYFFTQEGMKSMLTKEDVRTLRQSRRMTQKELAVKSGLSTSLIAQIEAGKKKITQQTASKLSKAFKTSRSLGRVETAQAADLSNTSLVMMWDGKVLSDNESIIIRNLAKTLVEQRK
jgi:transcriptional regulator with XRE-family HTH domain